MITAIHFISPANSHIEAVWDDGRTARMEWPLTTRIEPVPVNPGPDRDGNPQPTPRDYWKKERAVREWLDDGNTPTAYDPDYGLTAEEIVERDAKAQLRSDFTELVGSMSPINRALLKLAFSNHNKIRVLEGNTAHTKAQFAQWLEANT